MQTHAHQIGRLRRVSAAAAATAAPFLDPLLLLRLSTSWLSLRLLLRLPALEPLPLKRRLYRSDSREVMAPSMSDPLCSLLLPAVLLSALPLPRQVM